MTVNDLKQMVDGLVSSGLGDLELRMDTDPDDMFDIDFMEFREDEDGVAFVGVVTNDNH
jgi:hypothetical protein